MLASTIPGVNMQRSTRNVIALLDADHTVIDGAGAQVYR